MIGVERPAIQPNVGTIAAQLDEALGVSWHLCRLMFYLVPSHVDVRSVQKDPALTTEQPQEDSDPVTP